MINNSDDIIDFLGRDSTLSGYRMVGDMVQNIPDSRLRNICVVNGTAINPFFVPTKDKAAPTLTSQQWLYVVAQARIAAANTDTRRILVAAPMKSGSTFISKAFSTGFNVPRVSLIMLLARAYDYALYGAAIRAHEVDEMALLTACCNAKGFVAHHHMLASPYLTKQASLYGLDVVLIRRNIFDMLVSLDDFLRQQGEVQEEAGVGNFFRQGLPDNYRSLDFDRRISRLLDRNLNFYVSYYVSWALAEQHEMIKPFWISYEDEIAGGSRALSGRVATAFAKNDDEASHLAAALAKGGNTEHVHFNKGVAGRGKMITGHNRERVLEAFSDFKNVADWSELLD